MKCSEVKIWFDNVAFENDAKLPEIIKEHLNKCESCNSEFKAIQQTLSFLLVQREKRLSHEKKSELVNLLVSKKEDNRIIKLNTNVWLTRVAAILVLAFGLLTGVILGGKLLSNADDSSVWSTEFTMLSENVDYSMFE